MKAQNSKDSLSQPLAQFSNECKNAIADMSDTVVALEATAQDAKDEIATLTLQRDEEHGALIMSQEQISRLQHDLNNLRKQREGDSRHTEDRLRAAAAETNTAKSLLDGMEHKLHKKMEELADSNEQNGRLQQRCQEIAAALAAARADFKRKEDQLRHTLDSKSKAHRDAQSEVGQHRAEITAKRKQLIQQRTRIEILEKSQATLQGKVRELQVRERDAEGNNARRLQALKNELQNLHEQLDRTRMLYDQVRTARDQIRDDNLSLKQEMETFRMNINANVKGGELGE